MRPPHSHPDSDCQGLNVGEELVGGYGWVLIEVALPCGEGLLHIVFQLELYRIRSNDEGAAEVSFPLFKDRPEIEEQDVVCADHQVWRIFCIGQEGVLARADDSLVPVGGDAIQLFG